MDALRWKVAAEDRWQYNFIGGTGKVTLMVSVTAAENNGWRADVGLSQGGKVIEKSSFVSVWKSDFEEAAKAAKSLARKYKIRWKPQHFVIDKGHKPGTPPPVEE